MFYKNYLLRVMNIYKKDSNQKIDNINNLLKETKDELIVQIEENDENCKKHWENQKKQIEELTEHYNMLVNAFNEQREVIEKIIKKIENKETKQKKRK